MTFNVRFRIPNVRFCTFKIRFFKPSTNVHRTIIATGGSAVYSDRAMEHLRSIGTVVYLQISYKELANRLGDLQERGVVMKGGMGMSLADLYEERLPLYEKWADIIVDVEKTSITKAAKKVVAALRERA